MTNKEALENIKSRINSLSLFPKVDRKTYDESWRIIEKDLEVLEIIKALFKENVELGSKVCIGKSYYDINFLLFTSKDAYNKIKEWLDDKQM